MRSAEDRPSVSLDQRPPKAVRSVLRRVYPTTDRQSSAAVLLPAVPADIRARSYRLGRGRKT